mgnify:FL=1
MTEITSDVSPESSTGAAEDSTDQTTVETDAGTVIPGSSDKVDRPAHNLKAEFDRKLGKMEERFSNMEHSLAEMVGVVTNAVANRGTQPKTESQKEYSDDELLEMSQAGSKEAMDLLIERKIERRTVTNQRNEAASNFVVTQLRGLYSKYPVLKDSTHPLTKAALAVRNELVASGFPATVAADLEAIKTAIAHNPGLAAQVAEARPSAEEEARQAAVDQAEGGFRVRSKESDKDRGKKPVLTKEQLALAKRMGVKDPAGARARMLKRAEQNQSGVSPLLFAVLEGK